jgi:hypothetical protein
MLENPVIFCVFCKEMQENTDKPKFNFGLHYQQNLSENPWCAVIGLSLPSLAPHKWIFSPTTPRTRYRCVLPVAPKTDSLIRYKRRNLENCFLFIIKIKSPGPAFAHKIGKEY